MNAKCHGGPYDGKVISLPPEGDGTVRVQMAPKPGAAFATPSAIPMSPELRTGTYILVESKSEEFAYLRWMGEG